MAGPPPPRAPVRSPSGARTLPPAGRTPRARPPPGGGERGARGPTSHLWYAVGSCLPRSTRGQKGGFLLSPVDFGPTELPLRATTVPQPARPTGQEDQGGDGPFEGVSVEENRATYSAPEITVITAAATMTHWSRSSGPSWCWYRRRASRIARNWTAAFSLPQIDGSKTGPVAAAAPRRPRITSSRPVMM